MTMADIWLTAAARAEYEALRPAEQRSVIAAFDVIASGQADHPGSKQAHRLNIPAGPAGKPFFAVRSGRSDAPVVIYRSTTRDEGGDWLVVSLMKRDDYDALRRAEGALAVAPPAVREIVNAVVAGTVSTFHVERAPAE